MECRYGPIKFFLSPFITDDLNHDYLNIQEIPYFFRNHNFVCYKKFLGVFSAWGKDNGNHKPNWRCEMDTKQIKKILATFGIAGLISGAGLCVPGCSSG
jgi:radical SAM modification target selenobiotic family peptide